MVRSGWMVDPRERHARVIAAITAIVTSSWLVVLAFFWAPAALREDSRSLLYVTGVVGLAASVSVALARRAFIARSPERWSKAWKDLLNPWTYCLGMQVLWLAAAPPLHSRFFPVHMAIVGATILLSLVGRRADRRPYR
jgi:hypothetical protein